MYVPTQIEFLQTPGYVLILFERAHTYRIIPTDPRPHIGAGIAPLAWATRVDVGRAIRWSSTSRITTRKPWFDQAANFYSNTTHMVERFTLIDPDTIHYEVTIEDSNRVYDGRGRWPCRCAGTGKRASGSSKRRATKVNGTQTRLIRAGQRIYPGVTRRDK